MTNELHRKERKSNHKFEVVRGQELLVQVVQVALPTGEMWEEMQTQVEGQLKNPPLFETTLHLKICTVLWLDSPDTSLKR